MKIYLSTWLTDRSLGETLTKKNAPNRLVSFYFLVEQKVTTKMLKIYRRTGICDMRQFKKQNNNGNKSN
jgi:hypothetical protein